MPTEDYEGKLESLPSIHVHYDFQPIKIRVYRNGDVHDDGRLFTVTRREFKHWVIFLDAITAKLRTTTPVHRIHTISGSRIDHFDELEQNGEYVAVERGPFVPCNYGIHRRNNEQQKWDTRLKISELRPAFLESAESMDIYLKKEGYGSYTGLPYPFDGIVMRSPSSSSLHMKSHYAKIGGSMERLSRVGTHVWEEDSSHLKIPVAGGKLQLPKLVGIDECDGKSQVINEQKSELPAIDTARKLPLIENKIEITEEQLQEKLSEENLDELILPQLSSVPTQNEIIAPSKSPKEKSNEVEDETLIVEAIIRKSAPLELEQAIALEEKKLQQLVSPDENKNAEKMKNMVSSMKSSISNETKRMETAEKGIQATGKTQKKPWQKTSLKVKENQRSGAVKPGSEISKTLKIAQPEEKSDEIQPLKKSDDPKNPQEFAPIVDSEELSNFQKKVDIYEDVDVGYVEGCNRFRPVLQYLTKKDRFVRLTGPHPSSRLYDPDFDDF